MSQELDDLAAKGRAQKALAEADGSAQKEAWRAQARAAALQQPAKLAVWRTSPRAVKMRLPKLVFHVAFMTFYLTSFAMAFPYFIYFWTGKTVHGSSRAGGGWKLDPTKEGYTLLWPFLILSAVVLVAWIFRRVAWRNARESYAQELAWAARQPFPLVNYPQALGEGKFGYRAQLFFRERVPSVEHMKNLLASADTRIDYDTLGERVGRMDIDYKSDVDGSRDAQGLKYLGLVHLLMESVLIPLHADHPLVRIEFAGRGVSRDVAPSTPAATSA